MIISNCLYNGCPHQHPVEQSPRGTGQCTDFWKSFPREASWHSIQSRFCWLAIYMSNKSISYKATNVGVHPKRNMSGVEQK